MEYGKAWRLRVPPPLSGSYASDSMIEQKMCQFRLSMGITIASLINMAKNRPKPHFIEAIAIVYGKRKIEKNSKQGMYELALIQFATVAVCRQGVLHGFFF